MQDEECEGTQGTSSCRVQNIQDGCGILHISCMIDDDIDDY